jgi:hypothetical protein
MREIMYVQPCRTACDVHVWSTRMVVDCDILAPVEGDILAQDLIKLIKYSYQQGVSFFPESCLERISGLSMLGSEQS